LGTKLGNWAENWAAQKVCFGIFTHWLPAILPKVDKIGQKIGQTKKIFSEIFLNLFF